MKSISTETIDDLIKNHGINKYTIPTITSALILLHNTMRMYENFYSGEYEYDEDLIMKYVDMIFVKMCDFENSHELCELFYEHFNVETSEKYSPKKRYYFPTRRFNALVCEGKVTAEFIKVCRKHIGEMNWVFRDYLEGFHMTDNFHKYVDFYLVNCVIFVEAADVDKYFGNDTGNIKTLMDNDISVYHYCDIKNVFETVSAKVVYGDKIVYNN